MSQTKFSKGEWIHIDADFSDFDIAITTQKRWDASEVNITEVTVNWEGELAAEQKANAHLIATAPDMYAMLKEISAFASFKPDDINLRAMKANIDTLLKKSRGE